MDVVGNRVSTHLVYVVGLKHILHFTFIATLGLILTQHTNPNYTDPSINPSI